MSLRPKKIVLFGIILIMLLAVIMFLYNFLGVGGNREKAIEETWKIDLPQNIKEVYYEKDIGWFGEGFKYSIYQYSGQELKLMDGEFNNNKNLELEDRVNDILLELDVPEKKYPDFNTNYLWLKLNKDDSQFPSQLYMIYDNSKSKLHLIQDIK